jgi:hypothetical protein
VRTNFDNGGNVVIREFPLNYFASLILELRCTKLDAFGVQADCLQIAILATARTSLM